MKSIGVLLLVEAPLPTNEAEIMKRITDKFQATASFKVGQLTLNPTSQNDLEEIANHRGEMIQIVADEGADAGELLSEVHAELVKRQCCY